MAKKKSDTPQVRQQGFYNKKTDEIELRFYTGRKRATEAEKRSYIKEEFKKINPVNLSAEDRQYYGRIKGGKSKAEKAVRLEGKFVSPEFVKAEKLDEAAKAAGYEDINLYLKEKPKVYTAAVRAFNSTGGIKMTYTTDRILQKIDQFGGVIVINGIEYSKLQALKTFDDLDKKIKRKFDAYMVQTDVRIRKGRMEINNLPTNKAIEGAEDSDELDEEFNIIISKSPPRETKTDEDTPDKFYEATIIEKGRHKKVKQMGKSKGEAMAEIRKLHKKAIIVTGKRIPKPKPTKKKPPKK